MDISQTIRLISVNELMAFVYQCGSGGGGGHDCFTNRNFVLITSGTEVTCISTFRHLGTLLYTVFRKWTFSVPIKWAVFGKVCLFDAGRFGSGLILCSSSN